jgi:hypothetical protein
MNFDTFKPVWRARTRRLFLVGAAASAVALSACGGGSNAAGAPAAVAAQVANVQTALSGKNVGVLKGKTRGGSQPIAWSLITLYAAGNSGYGSATAVGYGYSDENGDISAIYSCPSNTAQIYLVASGGDAGSGYNTAIGLSAPLGECGSLASAAVVNEVTTVASVYALSQFLDATGQQPGTSAANASGLNNAVAVFGNLADLALGTAQTTLATGASGTAPTDTVNTLADGLAACVASSGSSSSGCTALFSAATPSGGTAPTSTLQAALDIARNPASNVAAVFALAGTSGPFQPVLSAAPEDWTLAINFNGSNLNNTDLASVAIDAQGNAWLASAFTDPSVNGGNGAVIELSPTGVQAGPYIDNGAVNDPVGVAIDGSGNVWVANPFSASNVNGGLGSVTGLSSSGTSLSGSPFSGTGLSGATQVAVDGSGNVWLANTGSAFELQKASGYAGVKYPVSDGGKVAPNLLWLALDNAGNVWLPDTDNARLVELNNSGQQVSGSPYTGAGLAAPKAVAVDGTGNVWVANSGAAGVGVSEFALGSSGYTGESFTANPVRLPSAVAIDGAGDVWIANLAGRTAGVVELAGNGTSLSAGTASGMYGSTSGLFGAAPQGVAVDASGNVWVSGGGAGNVIELVGAAKPVKTPVVGQAQLP